eukprot:SAG31_NODE_43267_length_267_cov_35.839286_1_plen_41_part_10
MYAAVPGCSRVHSADLLGGSGSCRLYITNVLILVPSADLLG